MTGVIPASATLPTSALFAVVGTVEGAAMKGPGTSRSNRRILERLSQESVTVALDTEFSGADTLTIQAATRSPKNTVTAKVYRSPQIPGFPNDFRVRDYITQDRYEPFFTRLKLLPLGRISADLSPVQLTNDLFGLRGFRSCSLPDGLQLRNEWTADNGPVNGVWDDRRRRWKIPIITLKIVCHFLAPTCCEYSDANSI